MDELQARLKMKLDEMQKEGKTNIAMDFSDVARIYQLICMMKQIANIVEWCDD